MTTIAQDSMPELTAAYVRAWERIQTEQALISNELNQFRRRRRLLELEKAVAEVMDRLDDYSRAYIAAEMPKVYASGAQRAVPLMQVTPTFAQIDTEAVRRLSSDLFDDLLAKTQFVRQDTKRAIQRALKDRIIQGQILGDSPAATRKMVREQLEQVGIRGVRYANGRWVPLDTYASMAIRTKTAIAQNEGGINYGRNSGVEWFQCFDGASCGLYGHNQGPAANGYVGTAEEAMSYPVAHPNCVRSWSPIPGVTSKEAAEANKITPTKAQQADQLAAEEARRQAATRRYAAKRRHDARLAAHQRRVAS